jgi:hypothetical protein
MKGFGVGLALVFISAGGALAQQTPIPRFTDQEVRVGMAAMEWYVNRDASIRAQSKTLVVSDMSTGGSPDAPPMGAALQHKKVGLSKDLLARLRDVAAVPVVVCDSIDIHGGNDLCGVSGQWVWLVLSNAVVRGDGATVILQVRWLEHVAQKGEGTATTRASETFRLGLSRQEGRWHVESFVQSGVS